MKKYKIKKGFVSQKMGDKITVFDGEESTLYTFNESATFIFEKMKQGLGEIKIKELLTKNYGISEEAAGHDFKEMVLDLKKKKIIT